jgi:hypothetical protein
MLGQGRHIVREDYPSLLRSPLENGGIVGSCEPDLLDAHDVDVRLPTNQPTDNIVVEILVCGQLHDGMARLPATGQEAVADPGWVEAPFVLFANLGGLLLTFGQIRTHIGLMAEVESDD